MKKKVILLIQQVPTEPEEDLNLECAINDRSPQRVLESACASALIAGLSHGARLTQILALVNAHYAGSNVLHVEEKGRMSTPVIVMGGRG